MSKIIILGGGLAGLSAAYHLQKEYAIYEQSDRVGGLCKSEIVGEFIFDYSIHIIYTNNSYIKNLIKNILLKNNLILKSRDSGIYYKNVYLKYPFQSNLFGLPKDIINECITGLIQTKNRNIIPTNFKEWILATFGEGIAKHFMVPFNIKNWAYPLEKMDYSWFKERIPIPSVKEVLKGASEPYEKQFGLNACFFYPKKDGIEALPKSFLPFIKNLYLNSPITKISIKNKCVQVKGKTKSFNFLISTLPLPDLINLIEDVPKEIKETANSLEKNKVYTINLGINKPKITNKHWIYFPEEKYTFHRLSFPMNFSNNLAPKNKSSIIAEISTSKYKKIDENQLMNKVINELIELEFISSEKDISVKKMMVLNPAYIIYDLEHKKKIQFLKNFLWKNNIYSCGRFGEWEYLNMDHAILSGKRVAELINAL